MKKLIITTLVVFLCSLAFSFQDGWSEPAKKKKVNYFEQLKLSTEQMKQTESLLNDYRRNTIPIDTQLRIVDLNISSELDKDKPDFKIIEKLLTQRKELREKKLLSGLDTLLRLKKILDDNQWRKLKEIRLDQIFLR